LARQVEEFWPTDAAVSYAGVEEITPEGKILRRVLPTTNYGDVFAQLLNQFEINVPTMMIRKSALTKHGFDFDPKVVASEEYNLLMRIAARENFCPVKECLSQWRIQTNSLTNQAIYRWATEREYTLDQIREENSGIEANYPEAFEEAYARAKYYHSRFLMSQGQKAEARKLLMSVSNVNYKYLALGLLLYFPCGLWNLVHQDWLKRKYLSTLLRLH